MCYPISTSYIVQNAGLESFDIIGTGVPGGEELITLEVCNNSWIYDVDAELSTNRQLIITNCFRVEVTKCTIGRRLTANYYGANGGGLVGGGSTNCLFSDNIFLANFPPVEFNSAWTGNVLAYNYTPDPDVSGANWDINHGAHNSFNLYEGNQTPIILSDSYWGSQSNDTLFRNYIYSWRSGAGGEGVFAFRRYSYYNNVIGNVVGTIGVGDAQFGYGLANMSGAAGYGTANASAGSFPAHWGGIPATLTTRHSDSEGTFTLDSPATGALFNYPYLAAGTPDGGGQMAVWWDSNLNAMAGGFVQSEVGSTVRILYLNAGSGGVLPVVSTPVVLWTGFAGWQEFDTGTDTIENGGTTLQKGNYVVTGGGATGSQESLSGDTLETSYVYDSAPWWWRGSLTWPPVNPASPTFSETILPAGYRWVNGVDAPDSGGGTYSVGKLRFLRR
jgi:hypothetical protein